ncbi:hypothetical protein ACJX0J_016938, partial [Zea mays]
MDSRSQAPYKSSSFSPATTRDEGGGRTREVDRNFSLGALRDKRDLPYGGSREQSISEEDEQEGGGDHGAARGGGEGPGSVGGGCCGEPDLAALSAEVDAFLAGQDEGTP